MRDLFNEGLLSTQYQVGQQNVKHIQHGACEILKADVIDGKIYYMIRIIESGLKIKCIGTRLMSEVQS